MFFLYSFLYSFLFLFFIYLFNLFFVHFLVHFSFQSVFFFVFFFHILILFFVFFFSFVTYFFCAKNLVIKVLFFFFSFVKSITTGTVKIKKNVRRKERNAFVQLNNNIYARLLVKYTYLFFAFFLVNLQHLYCFLVPIFFSFELLHFATNQCHASKTIQHHCQNTRNRFDPKLISLNLLILLNRHRSIGLHHDLMF